MIHPSHESGVLVLEMAPRPGHFAVIGCNYDAFCRSAFRWKVFDGTVPAGGWILACPVSRPAVTPPANADTGMPADGAGRRCLPGWCRGTACGCPEGRLGGDPGNLITWRGHLRRSRPNWGAGCPWSRGNGDDGAAPPQAPGLRRDRRHCWRRVSRERKCPDTVHGTGTGTAFDCCDLRCSGRCEDSGDRRLPAGAQALDVALAVAGRVY